jgi:hypothetical protein
MENDLKQKILRLISDAQAAYLKSLEPENRNDMGYPYTAGYSRAALFEIQDLLESV